jgi:hypothetical protein
MSPSIFGDTRKNPVQQEFPVAFSAQDRRLDALNIPGA